MIFLALSILSTWGKGNLLRRGRDVTLFGTGVMTSLCLRAADLLAKEGIQAEVVHLGSIKPIDQELIVESVSRTGCAVTAENASIIGGFGGRRRRGARGVFPGPLASDRCTGPLGGQRRHRRAFYLP